MNKLTKKATKKNFEFSKEALRAFEEAIKRLSEPKVIAYPDSTLQRWRDRMSVQSCSKLRPLCG